MAIGNAAQRDEQRARREVAGIDTDAAHLQIGVAKGPAVCRACDFSERELGGIGGNRGSHRVLVHCDRVEMRGPLALPFVPSICDTKSIVARRGPKTGFPRRPSSEARCFAPHYWGRQRRSCRASPSEPPPRAVSAYPNCIELFAVSVVKAPACWCECSDRVALG